MGNEPKQPTIYLYAGMDPFGDLFAAALAEDGTQLGSTYYASVEAAHIGTGAIGAKRPGIYRRHYPDGYTLEWVEDRENHAGFQAAWTLYMVTVRPGKHSPIQ